MRSHPRSLLSIARLNSARSRRLLASSNRIRIAQIYFSLKGGFWPTSFPLFQGTFGILVGVEFSMTVPSLLKEPSF